MHRLKDLTGKTFNKLTVLERIGSNRQGSSTWLCICECGNKSTFSSDHLTRKSSPVKSCGCSHWYKGSSHKSWGGYGEISGNWWYNHVSRENKNRKRTRVPVTVTIQEAWELFLKQDRKCALSGQPINISNAMQYNTASIDRIDSSRGYEPDNIQWVHKHVNFMKRTYSQDYFIETCKKIAETHKYKCELK